MQSLMPIHCFLFEIQIIKNGFTGRKSFRDFRETGPWCPCPGTKMDVVQTRQCPELNGS